MKKTQPFEYSVVANGGRLFLIGSTDRYCRFTRWEAIKFGFTNRIPDRLINEVRPRSLDDLQNLLHQAKARYILNMSMDDLSVVIDEYPFPRPVTLVGRMPGADGFQDAWKRVNEGTANTWHVRVELRVVLGRQHQGMLTANTYQPIDFLFELHGSDDHIGVDHYGRLEHHMRQLVQEYLSHTNAAMASGTRPVEIHQMTLIKHEVPVAAE